MYVCMYVCEDILCEVIGYVDQTMNNYCPEMSVVPYGEKCQMHGVSQ